MLVRQWSNVPLCRTRFCCLWRTRLFTCPSLQFPGTPEVFDARCVGSFLFRSAVRRGRSLRSGLPTSERNTLMILNVVLLSISAALFVYLVYALLRPEKF